MSRLVSSRFHGVTVGLHWVVALMIVGLLCLGYFVLEKIPNSDPKKLDILVWHMSGGMAVFALMLMRVLVRSVTARPAAAPTGVPPLDRLAAVAHGALYAIVFMMVGTGFYTGYLISGVFVPNGPPLPATFAVLPSFQIHSALAALLSALIVVHVAGALYHQFVLKDRLFRRMWFGRRSVTTAERQSA